MSEKYMPVKGDRVRVVLEGEVTSEGRPGTFWISVADRYGWDNHINPEAEHVVSIEKIEPPVETFGPGDTVRHKRFQGLVYSIGRDGYYAHQAQVWRPGVPGDEFTSESYERVEFK